VIINKGLELTIAICLIQAPTHSMSQTKSNEADSDRVYSAAEVDKKAIIDKFVRDLNAPKPSGCKGQGTILLGAVLRKSGKVTNIKVQQPSSCTKFEERVTKAVSKTKFKPAQKNGAAVSMYYAFEFNYNCPGYCP